ncbi:MAG: putative cytokinetic ring protein SteA [Actinomycetota bacterium]
MRLLGRRRRKSAGALPAGRARVDPKTKHLVGRLQRGEIAVIDHTDLDRVSAEALVERRPAAVVNASPSISGRYPNLGPEVLLKAGIPVLDRVGTEVMHAIREGDVIAVDGHRLMRDGEVVAEGVSLGLPEVHADMATAKRRLGEEIEAFAENTMTYVRRERGLLLEGVGVPRLDTPIRGKHVLVVVRGYDYKEDLATLGGYIREFRPVLVGVDGGADALLEEGSRPDLIVGDMDSVSSDALACGAEIVVHAYPDGRAPGLARVQELGISPKLFPASATSEDIALLLAYEHGAELIVAVGCHANLVEFLDKGRPGMASSFLVRLKVGTILVDAKGVNRLYRTRVRTRELLALVAAALLAMAIVSSASEGLKLFWEQVFTSIRDLFYAVGRLLS